MNVHELANILEVDEITVRRFLRDITPQHKRPGRGNRWEVRSTPKAISILNRQWFLWSEAHTGAVSGASGSARTRALG